MTGGAQLDAAMCAAVASTALGQGEGRRRGIGAADWLPPVSGFGA